VLDAHPRTPIVALLAGVLVTVASVPAIAQSGDGAPEVPRFVNETKPSKLKHTYSGDWQYFVGGGVAAFDCNDDALPELYLAGGSKPAGLWLNASGEGGPLRFKREPGPITDLDGVTGAYPLDIDSDGITDLAVLRVGETVLLRGLGDCGFERANETWGFDGGNGWTTAFAATWEGDNALPTLALGTYVDAATSNERIGNCGDNRLYRPNAAGTGYDAPIVLTPGFCALSMLFSDWNRDGQRDLRVSNDRHYAPSGEEQLWRMTPGEAPTLFTEADGWQKLVIWGMGIGSTDLTGDGKPEIYLTSQGDNKLQTLVDGATGPTYEDIALERGVTAAKPVDGKDPFPSTAWHPAFEDVNNDGRVDLFLTKGNVEKQEGYAKKDPSQLFLQAADGTFAESTKAAGLLQYDRGRGAAVVDLNRDGLLDIVEVFRTKPVKVWRNMGSAPRGVDHGAPLGPWIELSLQQAGTNPDAIGAIVEVRTGGEGGLVQTREITVGGGHASGTLAPLHVGLPSIEQIEVRVTWPDGTVGEWLPVEGASRYTIDKDSGTITPAA
jgi:hypothetical protein